MSIQEVHQKIKKSLSGDVAVIAIIVLVGVASFGLGRLSVLENMKEPVKIEYGSAAVAEAGGTEAANESAGKFVASKNSSVYHFPWCPGAQRIAEQNKIWFDSAEAAQRAGYRPAKNCKGLE